MEKIIAYYKYLTDELLEAPKLPFNDDLKKLLPQAGGVYHIIELFFDEQRSIYVGKSNNL